MKFLKGRNQILFKLNLDINPLFLIMIKGKYKIKKIIENFDKIRDK